jgi:GNAT superfamily N-acetyltransferase
VNPTPTQRPLGLADLPAALRLSEQAGWNQVADDWRLMLRDDAAIGLDAPPVIAPALTVPLGARLAWISMVLVDAAWRRQGLGTRLLRRCIADLSARGVIAGLDATPAGRLVYAPLGFQPLYGLSRLIVEPVAALDAPPPPGVTLRPVAASDIAPLAAWDEARTFMQRGALLADLQRRLPEAAWLALRDGALVGCVLGRDGRLSNQLGPVLADDADVARALIARALARTGRAAILDVPDPHAPLQTWLHAHGAVTQRGYTRMLLGAPATLPPPERLFAIAGPELG